MLDQPFFLKYEGFVQKLFIKNQGQNRLKNKQKRAFLTKALVSPVNLSDIVMLGGWQWTDPSPTGSGPEGSSPNDLETGRRPTSYFKTAKLILPTKV